MTATPRSGVAPTSGAILRRRRGASGRRPGTADGHRSFSRARQRRRRQLFDRGDDLVRDTRGLRIHDEHALGPDERRHASALPVDAVDVAAELRRLDDDFLLRSGRFAEVGPLADRMAALDPARPEAGQLREMLSRATMSQ